MSLNRVDIQTKLDLFIKTNGNRAITGAILNDFLTDIIDSYTNLIDEENFFGFLVYDKDRGYKSKEGFFLDGNIWQTNEPLSIGLVDPKSKSTQITGLVSNSDYGFLPWDAGFNGGLGYPIEARVEEGNKLWKSLVANNTTNPLTPAQTDWEEVSASNGVNNNDWFAGFYKMPIIVNNLTDNVFYRLVNASVPFESTDIDAEILTGDWEVQHNVGGGITPGTPNRYVVYDALGALANTSSIIEGVSVSIVKALNVFGPLSSEDFAEFFDTDSGNVLEFEWNAGTLYMNHSNGASIEFKTNGDLFINQLISSNVFAQSLTATSQVELRDLSGGSRSINLKAVSGLTTTKSAIFREKEIIVAGLSDIDLAVVGLVKRVHSSETSAVSSVLGAWTTIPGTDGFTTPDNSKYEMFWTGSVELVGDSQVTVKASVDGANVRSKVISNNQGGGASRTTIHDVTVKGSPLGFINKQFAIEIITTLGTANVIGQGYYHVEQIG